MGLDSGLTNILSVFENHTCYEDTVPIPVYVREAVRGRGAGEGGRGGGQRERLLGDGQPRGPGSRGHYPGSGDCSVQEKRADRLHCSRLKTRLMISESVATIYSDKNGFSVVSRAATVNPLFTGRE